MQILNKLRVAGNPRGTTTRRCPDSGPGTFICCQRNQLLPHCGPEVLRWDNRGVASEIVVALIGGVAGLTTGVVGSLFAPWANWGAEKRRRRQDRRVERIAEWPLGVRRLREAESDYLKSVHGHAPAYGAQPDATTRNWWATLRPELKDDVARHIEELSKNTGVQERSGQVPNLLRDEIVRLERDKWKLV
jgi:hypothetical protein